MRAKWACERLNHLSSPVFQHLLHDSGFGHVAGVLVVIVVVVLLQLSCKNVAAEVVVERAVTMAVHTASKTFDSVGQVHKRQEL